jgi:hypothetical protein
MVQIKVNHVWRSGLANCGIHGVTLCGKKINAWFGSPEQMGMVAAMDALANPSRITCKTCIKKLPWDAQGDFRMKEFNVAAFEIDFIRHTIGFGEPIFKDGAFSGFSSAEDLLPGARPSICLNIWLSFVPEVYLAAALRAAEAVFTEFVQASSKVTDKTLEAYHARLFQWIHEHIEPVLDNKSTVH